MPIATPEVYADMIRRAKEGGFAYPAINCTSSQTLNAALRGFADAGSDGIIQFSTGGAEFVSGTEVKDMVTGAVALAEFAHVVAEKYPVNVALHTDHCPKDKLDGYVRPLIALSKDRVDAGQEPLFQSHMWDGSAMPLDENLQIAEELLEKAARGQDRPRDRDRRRRRRGGRRRGRDQREALHRRPSDFVRHRRGARAGRERASTCCATFGNVHGVYKPGNVKLRPEILKQAQERRRQGVRPRPSDKPFNLVFHGGSGSAAGGDPRGRSLRRREDERRHRHPVRLHPADRRPHVHQLRRRPQGRRRGRQQEGLRPARLARPPRRAWPRGSSRRARTCCRPATQTA